MFFVEDVSLSSSLTYGEMGSVRQPFVVVVKGWDASLLRILILRFGESYRNDILRGLRLCEVYR